MHVYESIVVFAHNVNIIMLVILCTLDNRMLNMSSLWSCKMVLDSLGLGQVDLFYQCTYNHRSNLEEKEK